MKQTLTYISIGVLVLLLAFLLIISCSKTIIIDMRQESEQEEYIPRTKSDSTEVEDSVPITFSVTVEGWKDVEWPTGG